MVYDVQEEIERKLSSLGVRIRGYRFLKEDLILVRGKIGDKTVRFAAEPQEVGLVLRKITTSERKRLGRKYNPRNRREER